MQNSERPNSVNSAAVAMLLAACGCGAQSPQDNDAVAVSREALTQVSSANLKLKVLTNSCGANQVQDFFQIVNSGTTSVLLSDLKIKLWVNETSATSLVTSINTGGCVSGGSGCVRSVTGTSASPAAFTPACGPDAGHQANREITLSTTDRSLLAPGQSWTNLQLAVRLSNSANFTPGTSTWYSRCLSGTSYTSDSHFALYYQGNLVFDSGLTPPTCRAPQGKQKLQGYLPSTMTSAPLVGPLASTTVVRFAVGLPLQYKADLQTFVGQVSDPSSPNYRAYLTPDEFTATYAPTQNTFNSIVTWATANGLTVDNPSSPSRMLVDIRGTAANASKALFANFVERLRPDGTKFYMLDREPSLELDTTVLRLSGLDNYDRPKPMGYGTGTQGNYMGRDFRAYYADCAPENKGAGQRIGIFALDGFDPDAIAEYAAADGLTTMPTITAVAVEGGSVTPSGGDGNGEVDLDIELAMGMAPEADEIVVFEGDYNNWTVKTNTDILDAMSSRQPLAYQLSSSFDTRVDENAQQFLNKMAAQGQSFFQASGDIGGYVMDGAGYLRNLWGITLVGGTELRTRGTNSWGDPLQDQPTEEAWYLGGGGVDTSAPLPDYQVGLDLSSNGGSTLHRNLPDVSMNAWNTEDIEQNPTEIHFKGGTSISTPLWAGFMALVNREAQQPVGFANPVIYAIGRDTSLYGGTFHDIDTGNNTMFNAMTGYDLATGWGSPKCALIAQLASYKPLVRTQVSVQSGEYHTCALLSDQTARCWGKNDFGQLGDGTTTSRLTPVEVTGIGPIASISGGSQHTCAVLPNHTVSCWGDNNNGQLGDGTTVGRTQPVAVTGLTNADAVSAGSAHTCAILSNFTVACWGSNSKGQLGDGTTTSSSVPITVPSLYGVLSLTAGTDRTCAVTADKLYCWGSNMFGRLGDGTLVDKPTPTLIDIPKPAGVALGDTHTCAMTRFGDVYCWGEALSGQLGDGYLGMEVSPNPTKLVSPYGVTQIASKFGHTCTVEPPGYVQCWGEGSYGQIGNGYNFDQATPDLAKHPPTFVQTTTTSASSCALTSDGLVFCWGLASLIGTGSATSSNVPAQVTF